jgi:hypothetical protein
MKKAVFWDVAPCRCGVNRRFGGTYRLYLQGRMKIRKYASEETLACLNLLSLFLRLWIFLFSFYPEDGGDKFLRNVG